MKAAGAWLALAVMACAGLQGCATTAAANGQHWEATGSNTAITTSNGSNKAVVKADTKDDFVAVAAAINKQMEPGGRWQFVSPGERGTIESTFADMGKLYDQFGSVDKMDQAAQVRLLADQSTVNAILTKKDGERLICQSEIPVGSHLPVKTCRTYAQIQSEQRAAQQSLEKRLATPQFKSGH